MENNQQSKDLQQIDSKNITDEPLKELDKAVKNFMKARGYDGQESVNQVNLTLIIFAILDVPEERFLKYLNRLNLIQLEILGIRPQSNKNSVH